MAASVSELPPITAPLVGNPEYDADISTVEDFVAQKAHPESRYHQKVVQNYYLSRLYKYWLSIGADTSPVHFNSRINIIEKQKQLDPVSIGNLFYYMAQISCNNPIPERSVGWGKTSTSLYPLPNGVGFYGLNTYLYALFEKILLVGIPVGEASWDYTSGCAAEFIDHDLDHSRDLEWILEPENAAKVALGRKFYYHMHQDPSLSQPEKKCHVIFLFFFYHEFAERDFSFYAMSNPERDVDLFLERARLFDPPFTDTFRSIREITYTTSALVSLVAILDEALGTEGDSGEYLNSELRDCIEGLIGLPLEEIDIYLEDIELSEGPASTRDYIDSIMAYWYHIGYFVVVSSN